MHGSSSRRIAGVLGGALLILGLLPAAVLAATPPTFTTGNSATFTVGVAGSFRVTATGTPTPALSKTAGFLPTGVTFTDSTTGTTTIAGTPAAGTLPGAYTITITASNGALPDATQPFTLTVNAATNYLNFYQQPGGGAAKALWSQQPIVEVLNSNGRVGDSSTYVTLAISTNPAGGTLRCTSGTTLQVTSGAASFYGCSIDITSSSTYTLSATSSASYSPTTSSAFYIGGSSSQSLVFATQPGGGAAGAVWTQQPVVKIVNSLNQVVTTDNSTVVYLAISTNPAGGTLSCTGNTYETAVNGYAYFTGCSINVASSGYYTLGASSTPYWTPTTSSAFYVTGYRLSLAISVSSALGLRPLSGYTTSTPKTATIGKYVTWKFTGGTTLAGQRVNVMVAKKVNGVWGLPAYLKSVWADANGLVTFAWTSKTAAAINVRVQWPGSATYAVSTSKALGAYWK